MSSFQEDLADWVTEVSPDETAFKLPIAYRIITLVVFTLVSAACAWAIFLSHDQVKAGFGEGGVVIALILLYSSLQRELYLDFSTRTYRKLLGFGPVAFKQSGPFNDIKSVYIKRRGGGQNVPSLITALEFVRSDQTKGTVPLPLDWHVVSTEPNKEPALRKYATDLAKRIKVPMRVKEK